MFLQALMLSTSLGLCTGNLCYTGYTWSGWSSCSMTCGGGYHIRHCYWDGSQETEICGTRCFNGAEHYSGQCHCPAGTQMPCCEDILECASNPCKNGGTCNEHLNFFTCTCPRGTTGLLCDDLPDCASNPCKNGGTCVEHVGHYTCTCPAGTTGFDCDDILECGSNPCQNGGTCIEHINSYSCLCPTGTTGDNCIDLQECDSNPCQNGGTCIELVNSYNCSCTDSFTGVHCEKDLFISHEHSCRYGSHSGCYVVFRRKDSWQDAEKFCEARRGHLVVPNDMDEALYIENFLQSVRVHFPDARFWIGGQNVGSGSVQWVTHEDSGVERWPFAVDHTPHGTECVLMDGGYNFEWQSINCDAKMYFVCEERVLYNNLVG